MINDGLVSQKMFQKGSQIADKHFKMEFQKNLEHFHTKKRGLKFMMYNMITGLHNIIIHRRPFMNHTIKHIVKYLITSAYHMLPNNVSD